MRRWTTPKIPLRLRKVETLATDHLFVTISQGYRQLTIESGSDQLEVDAEEHLVYVTLTQEQTGYFKSDDAEIQVRGISDLGVAWESQIKTINVGRALLNGEISYG